MALSKILPASQEQYAGARNLIINGAMQVAQRGTSETGVTSSGYKNAPDRWLLTGSATGTFGTWSVSQSTDTPSGEGFGKSYKLECTTADASLAAGDNLTLQHRIEGQNLQQLSKGTSNAKSLTLSFWVKSNKTGTYIAELRDQDNARVYGQQYTISSSNTWEKKTLTYAGDTTGSLDNDNSDSLRVLFFLLAGTDFTSGTLPNSWASSTNANRAVGQVNLADSTSNEWYITGVQLEVGEQATPFEHRSYGDELRRCQRYYENSYSYGTAVGTSTSEGIVSSDSGISSVSTRYFIFSGNNFKVTKRAFPTLTIYSQGGTINSISRYNSSSTTVAVSSVASESNQSIGTYISGTTGDSSEPYNFHWVADAEL